MKAETPLVDFRAESQDSLLKRVNKSESTLIRTSRGVMHQGSCLSGFLTLFSSIGGSGMLALPYAYKLAGYGITTAVVAVGMLVNAFTCFILCEYARKKSVITMDQLCKDCFEDINLRCFSTRTNQFLFKTLYWLTGISTWMNYYGALIAYIIVIEKLFPRALYFLYATRHETPYYIWGPVLTVCIIFPVSTFKFKHVRFTSSINFLAVIFSAVTICVISIRHLDKSESVSSSQGDFSNIFTMVPIVLFAYTCQPDVGFIAEQLAKDEFALPTVLLANLLWMVLFLTVGMLGYFSSPSVKDQNVLNYSDLVEDRILAGLAMVAVCIALISCIPILVYPIVDVAFNMFGDSQSRVTRLCRLSLIAALVGAALVIAIEAREDYGLFIGFVGAVSCSYVCIFFPCICYLYNPPVDKPNAILVWSAWVLTIGTSAVFAASFIALVKQ